MPPNKENLRKWVAALRSGEFRQGRNRLFNAGDYLAEEPESYCCLGVVCEIMEREGTVEPDPHDGRHWRERAVLPQSAMKWLGVMLDNPIIGVDPKHGGALNAATANDHYDWTFDQIADQVETHFKLNERR